MYVYGMGRTVTALSGVLTVLALYAVAARWFAWLRLPGAHRPALPTAGFLVFSPHHVQLTHVTSPDVPTTAFVVLAMYCSVRILDSGATR